MRTRQIPSDLFRKRGVFFGTCFKMAIEFSRGAYTAAQAAHAALWRHELLHGPFESSEADPRTAPVIDLLGAHRPRLVHGAGLLPRKKVIPCTTAVYEQESEGQDGPSLCMWINSGALQYVYDIDPWPIDDGREHEWILELSEWFREIAQAVFDAVPFQGALIGCAACMDGMPRTPGQLPVPRWSGHLLPDGAQLLWFPPEVLVAPLSFEPQTY